MGGGLSFPETDLKGKVAIVTGGNVGIGYSTAKAFARLGAHTFIACRSQQKAEQAISSIKAELSGSPTTTEEKNESTSKGGESDENEGAKKTEEVKEDSNKPEEGSDKDTPVEDTAKPEKESEGIKESDKPEGDSDEKENTDEEVKNDQTATQTEQDIKLDFLPLDLSSLQSTVDCVKAFREKNLPLHILVNNAGIFAVPYQKTDDGHEMQFQVNHLGPLLFTLELLPVLLETASTSGDGRIVFLSSAAYSMGDRFNGQALELPEQNYKRIGAYSTSKLYTVMTGYALQRKLQESSSITVSSVNPGFVKTTANRGFEDKKFLRMLHGMASAVVARTPDQGAATSINAAVNPALNSKQHVYYESCKPKQTTAEARNEDFQEQLWKGSLNMLKDFLSPDTWDKYGPKAEEEAQAEESEPKPDESESKPDESEPKPDESELKPDDSEPKPDESEPIPTQEQSASDPEAKPVESAEPGEAASKPEESATESSPNQEDP